MRFGIVHIYLLLILLPIRFVFGQNLIVNPGAESPPIGNGWTEAVVNTANPTTAFHWTRANSGLGGVTPHGGSYHFYAGDNSNGNYYLYQDIDVSAYTGAIDAGSASFVFSYWFRIYNLNNDRGHITVEYLNSSNTVLSTYNSGTLINVFLWSNFTDTRTAPIGTRKIRISLFADRISGTAADAYFDDLSLTTTAPLPLSLIDFNIKKIGLDTYQADWTVSNETDISAYSISISTDLIHWKKIDEVMARNNRALTNYESDLLTIQPTDTFYVQLSEINSSNQATVVAQKVVPMSTLVTPYIYPNPCTQGETVNVISNTILSFEIYNAAGTLVTTDQDTSIQTSGLIPGVYFIKFLDTGSISQLIIQ